MKETSLLEYEVSPPIKTIASSANLQSLNSEIIFRNAQKWRDDYQLKPFCDT